MRELDSRPLVWVPIYPSDECMQEFALIFQHQKDEYDASLRRKGIGMWWVHPADFRHHMSLCVDESGIGYFDTFLKTRVGISWNDKPIDNIVISLVQRDEAMRVKEQNPNFVEIMSGDTTLWVMTVDDNFTDINNPVNGFVVFRGYLWRFKQFLTPPHHNLLLHTYYGSGQDQNITNHRGNNRMILFRQTGQANNSMGAVSSTR